MLDDILVVIQKEICEFDFDINWEQDGEWDDGYACGQLSGLLRAERIITDFKEGRGWRYNMDEETKKEWENAL